MASGFQLFDFIKTIALQAPSDSLPPMTLQTDRFIALEIHDASLWEPTRVLPAIETMERWGYNALVLHQNDLLDVCTQLGLTANYGVTDLRLKKVRAAAAWMNRLCARLDQFGAKLFLEVKEPSFHDYAVELFPELLGTDGRPNPGSPEWLRFCRAKTEDLLTRVPQLGGLIVTISSPESRVSLPDYLAETGTEMSRVDWFEQMIRAFHDPLQEQGKALYIRDFSYTADMQSDVLAAVARFGGSVGASVKITAHDYFPEFPENPAIAMTTAPLVLECEAFGEHMGWGVIPNCRVHELAERMDTEQTRRAQGVLMRISWEAITEASALDTLNAVNVFALPHLVGGKGDPDALVLEWLTTSYGVTDGLAEQIAQLLKESWQIPAAAYWSGEVFPRHSCLPSSWQEGWLSMQSKGMGRRDRDIGTTANDPRLTEEAVETLFAQKAAATARAQDLSRRAQALAPQCREPLREALAAFQWLPVFARQFELAMTGTVYAARSRSEDAEALKDVTDALEHLAQQIEHRFEEADAAHHVYVLFDPAQIRRLASSLIRGEGQPT